MATFYLWPEHPALSLLFLWLLSTIVLWAARDPMLQLLRGLGSGLEEGLKALARSSRNAADELRKRTRSSLLASGALELQHKLEREFHRIDASVFERLGQYSLLHRRVDDLLQKLEADYERCGDSPPEVPGWAAAVEKIATIPSAGDANVHKILEGARRSLRKAEKKALAIYRSDTSRRHRLLGAMRPTWKEIRGLTRRMKEAAARVLATTSKVNAYIDDYARIRDDEKAAAQALSYSATKLFAISVLVLAVALGGAFINFQLIALPMSELVPAGARLGGVPVATVSALVIVLMEIAVGVFLMDMLGITELFPKLGSVAPERRRLILFVALGGLFSLAAVESSLAVLREMIVEADASLKLSLAGREAPVVEASASRIPVVGQAVLGFVLPWILAMVAIPLEMLLDSARHVLALGTASLLGGLASLLRGAAQLFRAFSDAAPQLYDAYISLPVRIERALREGRSERSLRRRRRPGELREETLA